MAAKRPEAGRPPRLTEIVRYDEQVDDDGGPIIVPVTLAEQVVERIRTGLDLNDAAASSNITRQTIWNWRRKGALARARRAQGKAARLPDADAYVQFVDALERAEAEAELTRLQVIEGAAMGGFKTTRTVITYGPDGSVVGRVVTEETVLPNWLPAAWWLERRRPAKYVRPSAATPSPQYVPDDGLDDERAEGLLAEIESFLADATPSAD